MEPLYSDLSAIQMCAKVAQDPRLSVKLRNEYLEEAMRAHNDMHEFETKLISDAGRSEDVYTPEHLAELDVRHQEVARFQGPESFGLWLLEREARISAMAFHALNRKRQGSGTRMVRCQPRRRSERGQASTRRAAGSRRRVVRAGAKAGDSGDSDPPPALGLSRPVADVACSGIGAVVV